MNILNIVLPIRMLNAPVAHNFSIVKTLFIGETGLFPFVGNYSLSFTSHPNHHPVSFDRRNLPLNFLFPYSLNGAPLSTVTLICTRSLFK